MKDKKIEKIKQHYDIYINDVKFKVIACNINKDKRTLSIKTKIRGQSFPENGQLTIKIPSLDYSQSVCATFEYMMDSTKIEHWVYHIEM